MFLWTHGGPAVLRMVVLHKVKVSKKEKVGKKVKLRMGFAKQGRMYCMTYDVARINVSIMVQ